MNVTVRPMLTMVTVLVCTFSAGAHGRGQNFFFVEETWRLPPDTTLPGTSTTDVDVQHARGHRR